MVVRVGINGFGRIGRLSTRIILDDAGSDLEIVHINEAYNNVEGSAYLLEFDSIHGRLSRGVSVDDGGNIVVEGAKCAAISHSSHPTLEAVPWADLGVELVLECSGAFNDAAKLKAGLLEQGVQRVLVAAPVKEVLNVVVGCNEELITPELPIVTAASCTTNCIGPVIKCVDAAFGIERGFINTLHNVTNTQSIMDAPNSKKSDLRRSRSGMVNLAPTSTGSAKAITMIFPHLTGKLNGVAVRVPIQVGASLADLTLEVSKDVSAEEVNEALNAAADGVILAVEPRPLVSTDFVSDSRSSIVDARSTMVVDRKLVKILVWYDNEFGYSTRMKDIANIMAEQMKSGK